VTAGQRQQLVAAIGEVIRRSGFKRQEAAMALDKTLRKSGVKLPVLVDLVKLAAEQLPRPMLAGLLGWLLGAESACDEAGRLFLPGEHIARALDHMQGKKPPATREVGRTTKERMEKLRRDKKAREEVVEADSTRVLAAEFNATVGKVGTHCEKCGDPDCDRLCPNVVAIVLGDAPGGHPGQR